VQHQHSGPPSPHKDVYQNREQRNISVKELSLEDYTLYFFHVYYTGDQKEEMRKTTPKGNTKNQKIPFSD